MLLAFLLAAVALQAWAWRRLRGRIAAGEVTRLGALVAYGGWALAPFLSFLGLFAGLVGLEELSGAAIVPEPLGSAAGPTAALLLGVAGLGWLGFSLCCARVRRPPGERG
jgi:hypothetical protein